ncbi:MAG: TetR/AcrR family transcriptional regulator [Candidatus Cloacimonetes bacterium]|nr:TetR/AcrR family transcriptional regulator [Candidatus Cloacimonadota bacterium]
MGSKENILKAALRVFLEKGYERTTINDVAKESKFTKGGLYHHFQNKERLFVETINFLFNEFERWETEIYTKSLSFKEILRIYFSSFGEVINFIKQVAETDKLEESNFYNLMFDAFQKFPEIKEKHNQTHKKNEESFIRVLIDAQKKKIIQDDIDPQTFAFMVNAMGEGTMIYHLISEKIDLKEMGEKLFQNVWKSIKI